MAVAASPLSRQEILNCSIPIWYSKFKSITFKSVFIPLPTDFVTYLKADGVILPRGCSLPSHKHTVQDESSDTESDEEKVDWSDSSDSGSSDGDKEPYFPAVLEQIQAAITDLGGRVIPKLNWSTPRDASWLLPGNTIQCTSVGEVILLLKSSDFVAHDLVRVFDYCEDSSKPASTTYTLCLRKWEEFHPSAEFRCFVHTNSLIAISQREYTTYYNFIASHKDTIRQEILDFFQCNIRNQFPDPNYVFDVFRMCEGDIRLVDFNPFCSKTDALLFSWEELTSIASDGDAPAIRPVMRVVESASTVQPHDLHDSRLPQDLVDLATGDDIHKFVDFFRMNKLDEDDSASD